MIKLFKKILIYIYIKGQQYHSEEVIEGMKARGSWMLNGDYKL